MVVFSSAAQEDYSEHTLVCLTNLGDLHLFNVPGLRPQVGWAPSVVPQPAPFGANSSSSRVFRPTQPPVSFFLCAFRCATAASVKRTSAASRPASSPRTGRVRKPQQLRRGSAGADSCLGRARRVLPDLSLRVREVLPVRQSPHRAAVLRPAGPTVGGQVTAALSLYHRCFAFVDPQQQVPRVTPARFRAVRQRGAA